MAAELPWQLDSDQLKNEAASSFCPFAPVKGSSFTIATGPPNALAGGSASTETNLWLQLRAPLLGPAWCWQLTRTSLVGCLIAKHLLNHIVLHSGRNQETDQSVTHHMVVIVHRLICCQQCQGDACAANWQEALLHLCHSVWGVGSQSIMGGGQTLSLLVMTISMWLKVFTLWWSFCGILW